MQVRYKKGKKGDWLLSLCGTREEVEAVKSGDDLEVSTRSGAVRTETAGFRLWSGECRFKSDDGEDFEWSALFKKYEDSNAAEERHDPQVQDSPWADDDIPF